MPTPRQPRRKPRSGAPQTKPSPANPPASPEGTADTTHYTFCGPDDRPLTMTAGMLAEILAALPADMPIVVSADAEGNHYGPLVALEAPVPLSDIAPDLDAARLIRGDPVAILIPSD